MKAPSHGSVGAIICNKHELGSSEEILEDIHQRRCENQWLKTMSDSKRREGAFFVAFTRVGICFGSGSRRSRVLSLDGHSASWLK